MNILLHSILFIVYLSLSGFLYSQEEEVMDFRITPNPTNGIVNIEIKYSLPYGGQIIDTNIEVYTITGDLITQRPLYVNMQYAGLYTISDSFYLTNCASGIYLIKMYMLGKLYVSRLILLK